ncbi:putative low complexity perhaps membrane associated [Cryptosporidium sp. chipmunk genotype I]|uniref:putative low complexity perhaps membrane associated n=1 Tax=Cryptosporidium sp. chipmunk genotype I TaxID=1280935 RepID=UPI00351A0BD0|nr:putative low complexity perhaps membrane associated [Cryptosporidium sp. chipmunk genotype I]
MYKQDGISPNFENNKSKSHEKNHLIDTSEDYHSEKINNKIDFSIEDFWFDYRIWCILFKVNLEQIRSINQFISNNILNTENEYVCIKSIINELEKKNPNNKIIRYDFERFRPNTREKKISFPKIPKGFYGIESFLELKKQYFNLNTSDKEYYQVLAILSCDPFPCISKLSLVDRLVIVTITVCEYLNFNYLQGMHEIVGCLAFLKKNPVPINYHVILSIEIINKWAKFLILPNLFNSYNNLLNRNKVYKTEKNFKYCEVIETNNENIIFGFLHNYFVSDQLTQVEELDCKDITENLQICLCNDISHNNLEMKPAQCFESKEFKPIYQNQGIKINAIEQILVICNEFHSFGYFHSPNIFNEIEKSIGSNIWSCNAFITCGSALFIEIENVLLFWLNLIFSSSEIDYKPPFFPKIQSSLQLSTFLIVFLKSLEHQLKNDVYLICTDRFKLDLDSSVRIGIISVLHPYLIPNNNIESTGFCASARHSSLDEFIEKKSLFLDLFQVILAMESLLMSTPISLQKKIINSLDNFNSHSSLDTTNSNYFINFIEPKELLLYDKDFLIKNKKCLDGIANIISGKDVVLIDILSGFYFDNAMNQNVDRLIKRLGTVEELIKLKELGGGNFDYELYSLFDEELLSTILLPMLRSSLKTTRIVKIPLENEKERINNQVICQFLEFATRRQRTLLIQQRPCIWILYGPSNKLRDNFVSTLIANGITGVQLIDTNKVFNELLENYNSSNSLDFLINIIKDVKSNLSLTNNKPNYKSRALLKISSLKKKNAINEPLTTMNAIDCSQNRKVTNKLDPKSSHEKQEYLNVCNKIIKFKPNRRKMYYK